MGFFGNKDSFIENEIRDPKELERAYLFDELARLNDEDKKVFAESEEFKKLSEAGLISKRTLVRLSKTDDVSRRRKMAAFQIAKDKKDSLWAQLVKNRIKERALIKAIMAKYGTAAERSARTSQKAYLKSIGNKLASLH